MTLQASFLLEDAWALYNKVATVPDGSVISRQSPSWLNKTTPYDFAAALCKSLLPITYNYNDAHHPGATQEIWDMMLDCGEVIDIKRANAILNRESTSA
jgi:hypothetical protein